MALHVLLLILIHGVAVIQCQYGVTIYPEFIKLGDVTHFDHDRWTGKNVLDSPGDIARVRQVGAVAARWLNRDLFEGLFEKATENPNKKGYPDPAYFLSHQHDITNKYLANIQGFGYPEIVMEIKGLNWPHWTDTSKHNGRFPNNVDVAAEFVYLLIQAVDKGSNGTLPLFFEVINEPDAQWENTDWTTYVAFHQAVAQKLKSAYPRIRVGGPTYTGASRFYDRNEFIVWKKMARFLDMALGHLDFFSFHSYTPMDVRGGTHEFHGNSEAKLFGLLDLIESYSHKKTGKSFNVIVSEYGMGGVTGLDVNRPSSLIDWGHIYQHNVQLFIYLERRDIVRKVVAFLLTYTDLRGQQSINYSIFDKHHNERDIAQAFKFWKNLRNTMTYLRVNSQYHNAERKIIPFALVDKSTGILTVLLHNHDKKPTHVKLNFDKGWLHPSSGNSTCEYLSSQNKAILDTNKPVHITNSLVTVPPEASCYFQFHTTHSFTHAPTVTETTYYSTDMVIPIHRTVDVKVNIPTPGKIVFAYLRFGVSLTNKSANPKPKTVLMNNHPLSSFFALNTHNGGSDLTVWQMYEYNIPVNVLQQHNNDIKLTFAQSGGYVSTVAVITGCR